MEAGLGTEKKMRWDAGRGSVLSALHELFGAESRHQAGLRLDCVGQRLIRDIPGEHLVDCVE
ncbi:hypothetical protein [Nitrosomonas communis]|uniref:hypothetical protein n=1 Tax=Nitrosomonas communis TaxID=44574 RepID=UPI001160806C|nr:hypothetical protein [Nitrosomonas communis]